ncbi:Uncharacterized protein dnl_39740 [Desulfonema limicola]|uniref:Uncharacterized protein n=1 Tax=Desulfonema limicola TaxID=45656 RepID=A0A975BAD8_9BACT|nr:hypothetical protein [Desulfonema limicola]QTA81632.1 Uncharacterized protein dnl_39740 [Desulfonema limicola]
MLNPSEIIEEINKICKIIFHESSFNLKQKTYNRFIFSGNYPTKAINHYKNIREEVSVIKWFNDFWLYIDIRFEKSDIKDNINTFISLSVFQGDDSDNIKKQLLRAEWDNFNNNDNHPQPHWHIYPDYNFEKTFNEFLEITEEDSFIDLLNDEKSKRIDIKRIHFAMNGDWVTQNGHIHKITDKNTIINWLQGLLFHIKSQLEYVE